MNRTVTATGVVNNITLSFQVGSTTADHDRMEIIVFNCPQKGIYTPTVKLFVDTAFRPKQAPFSFLKTSASLRTTSCNHLLKFCVKFSVTGSQFYSIQFPYQESSNYVFLGEVTFLNAPGEPCDPRMPEEIIAPSIQPATGSMLSTAIIWPNSTSVTQVDEATSPHPQSIDTTQQTATTNDSKSDSIATHQRSVNTTQQVATTEDSKSDSNYQMSTNGSSSVTHETRNNSIAAIALSIIFTSVSVLIILVVVLIIVRKINNCKHRSESDGSQLPLVESDGLQEDDDIAEVDLDKVLDDDEMSELHLGKIADAMFDWKGKIAEHLHLSLPETEEIKMANRERLDLQKREALRKWKQANGNRATYRSLIEVFEKAGYPSYATTVRNIASGR